MAKGKVLKAGDKVGDLTLIERVGAYRASNGNPIYICECSCGRRVRKIPSVMAQRVKELRRASAACCDECEPGKRYKASDLPESDIYQHTEDKMTLNINKWLSIPLVRTSNA